MSVNSHFASVSGPFLLYYNGKSAAHITPKTEQNGPHFFKTFGRLPDGRKTCWHVNDTALIHYPYSLIEEVRTFPYCLARVMPHLSMHVSY